MVYANGNTAGNSEHVFAAYAGLEHEKIYWSEYSTSWRNRWANAHSCKHWAFDGGVREELEVVREIYGDEERPYPEITAAVHDIDMEELITQEDVVVTLSNAGYVKYQI